MLLDHVIIKSSFRQSH